MICCLCYWVDVAELFYLLLLKIRYDWLYHIHYLKTKDFE